MQDYTIKHHDTMEDVKDVWTKILNSNRTTSYLCDYDVIASWYTSFLKSRKALLLTIWKDDQCLGIFPMMLQRKYGAFVINSLYEDGISLYHPVLLDDYRENCISLLFSLLGQPNFKWNVIKFSQVYSYDPYHQAILDYLQNGRKHYTYSEPTYCVDFDTSFDDYFHTYIASGSRRDYQRKLNRLKRASSHRYEFLCDEAALDKLHVFFEIENSGWKADMGVATLKSPPHLAFLSLLSKKASDSKSLFMALMYIDDVPIAGHCGYIHDKTYYLEKTAYLHSHAHYSPSVLLLIESIKYFIESDSLVRRLNFFPKSFGYKHKYTHDKYKCDTFVIPNNNISSGILFALYQMKMKFFKPDDPLKFVTSKDALQISRKGFFRRFWLFTRFWKQGNAPSDEK